LFLSLFYFTVNSGLGLTMHYCGGVLESIRTNIVDLGSSTKEVKSCCVASKKTTKGCCSDEVIRFSPSEKSVVLSNFSIELLALTHPVANVFSFPFCSGAALIDKSFYDYSYRANAPPLYKLFCQYTIYS
jgi:hypothetical protein